MGRKLFRWVDSIVLRLILVEQPLAYNPCHREELLLAGTAGRFDLGGLDYSGLRIQGGLECVNVVDGAKGRRTPIRLW